MNAYTAAQAEASHKQLTKWRKDLRIQIDQVNDDRADASSLWHHLKREGKPLDEVLQLQADLKAQEDRLQAILNRSYELGRQPTPAPVDDDTDDDLDLDTDLDLDDDTDDDTDDIDALLQRLRDDDALLQRLRARPDVRAQALAILA